MKVISIVLFVVLSLVFVVPRVIAQPYFTVYPTEGSVETEIFLQIRGLPDTGFYEWYYLYIFWDDMPLGTFPDNSGTYNHWFDTYFSPLNSGDYGALGNHTVYFEVWSAGRTVMYINASFIFTIVEYIPCSEYLALNATYYQLLANYTALNASYQNLMTQYNALSASYDDLLNQYNNLSDDYSNLLGSHNSLSSDYNELSTNYQSLNATYSDLNTRFQDLTTTQTQLQDDYEGLTGSYNSLQSIHNTLTSNYEQLQGNYTQLVFLHNNLQSDRNSLSTDLTNYRNLTVAFIITSVVFLATTIYFARRKQKAK